MHDIDLIRGLGAITLVGLTILIGYCLAEIFPSDGVRIKLLD